MAVMFMRNPEDQKGQQEVIRALQERVGGIVETARSLVDAKNPKDINPDAAVKDTKAPGAGSTTPTLGSK